MLRDYGLYDHAMLRFGRGHKLSENFYVRQDGTRAYYFSEGQHRIITMCVVQRKLSNQDTNVAQEKVSFTLRCPISEVEVWEKVTCLERLSGVSL